MALRVIRRRRVCFGVALHFPVSRTLPTFFNIAGAWETDSTRLSRDLVPVIRNLQMTSLVRMRKVWDAAHRAVLASAKLHLQRLEAVKVVAVRVNGRRGKAHSRMFPEQCTQGYGQLLASKRGAKAKVGASPE